MWQNSFLTFKSHCTNHRVRAMRKKEKKKDGPIIHTLIGTLKQRNHSLQGRLKFRRAFDMKSLRNIKKMIEMTNSNRR